MTLHNFEKAQMNDRGQNHRPQRGQTLKRKKEIMELAVEDSDDNTDENPGSCDSISMMKGEQNSRGSSDSEKTPETYEKAFLKKLSRIGIRHKSKMMIVKGRKFSTPRVTTGDHKVPK